MKLNEIDHTVSQYEKNKSNYQWDKDAHDIIQNRLGVDSNVMSRIKLKEKLAKGEMPRLNKLQQQMFNIRMYGHARKKDFNLIPHFPLIDQILEEAVGELERQPFEPMAEDIGLFSSNEKDRLHKEALQESMRAYLFEPYKQKATQEYLAQYGVADVAELSHEDQQQAQSDIATRTQELTPREINDYFENDYKSPFSEMAQMLLDLECKSKNLNNHFAKRFRHGYLNAAAISYIYKRYGLPRIDLIEREWFDWEGPEGVDCIEDGELATCDRSRSLIDVLNQYGELLTDSDLKKLEKTGQYTRGINGDFNILGPVQETQMMTFYFENHKEMFPNGINMRTQEGQEIMNWLRAAHARGVNGSKQIRDCHTVQKTQINMKYVLRSVKGRIEYSWRHNDYVMNPDFGDISVKTIKSVQVRGCRTLGDGTDKIYLEAGPLKFDWSDISDPQKKKLPYSGGWYGKDWKDTSSAPFDKGINFQIKINVENARTEEEKGFNIGKMFVMLESAMPDNYTPEMFFDVMKGTRIINLDETKLNPALAGALMQGGRIFNAIDMSNNVAVKESAEEVENLYRKMRRTMGVDGREISPYASEENVRRSQENSATRTYSIYNTHSRFTNNTLQMYMDFCMDTYAQNPSAIDEVANDMSLAILISKEFLALGRMGVYVGNTVEEQIELREFKQEMLPFIQNEAYHVIGDFARIKRAKSWGEVLNAASSLERKTMGMRQQAQESELAAQEQIDNKRLEEMERKYLHEARLAMDKNTNSLDMAEIASKEQLNAVDVNKNMENDYNEQANRQLKMDERRYDLDRELEEKKAADKLKVDLAKVAAIEKKERLATKVRKNSK